MHLVIVLQGFIFQTCLFYPLSALNIYLSSPARKDPLSTRPLLATGELAPHGASSGAMVSLSLVPAHAQ